MSVSKPAYTPSKTADFVLTSLLVFEVLYCLYIFFKTNIYDLYWFLFFCGMTCLAVKTTELFCKTFVYSYISGYLLKNPPFNHPLSKKRAFKKFIGSAWQFVIHFTMTIVEVIILKDETWLTQPWTCFTEYLTFEPKQSLRLFFLLQIAIWICTGFSHRFNSDAHMHKDYVPMYIHHLATIGLVASAYTIRSTRIGLIVLIIHDSSDIAIDLLKIFNYLRLEGKKGFFLVELAYASTIISWIYMRLYYFPRYIIGQGSLSTFSLFGSMFLPEGVTALLGNLSHVLQPNEYSYMYTFAVICNVLLIVLFLLHIWWGALLLRILVRIIKSNSAHSAGTEEYEGESDDESTSRNKAIQHHTMPKDYHTASAVLAKKFYDQQKSKKVE